LKVKREVVYRGPIFQVEEWINPDTGNRFARVRGLEAVGVLPVMKNGNILLERQYRHGLDKYLYEIPAGHIERGERPERAGKRELEEETGYLAGRMTHMLNMYAAPGTYTQLMYIYLAEDLKETKKNMDPDEVIELAEVSPKKALEMIRANRIEDAKTIMSILYYLRFIRK
jgi:ADP-ribose pyrophosphatase